LTNLISLARKRSDQLETSLLMLSGLMRYMLYDAGKKISLQQEAEYLESYVALQKLRVERHVKIVFDIDLPASASNTSIEPMLLIPFVENAFKHGTGFTDQPFIQIDLTVKEGILVFQVKNTFDSNTNSNRDEGAGIGLNNVRSRLALLYPGLHELVIHQEGGVFSINLTLKLLS
jgi:two-component system, LytTR family, sensor kinase